MENKIDLTQLRQLLGGDETMVNRFLELFKSEMPKQLSALEEQLENGDYAEANVTAHGIKGQLQTLGQMDLANLAMEIEHRTEVANPFETIAPMFQQLKMETFSLLASNA